MKIIRLFTILLVLLLLPGCSDRGADILNIKAELRPADIEPTATYDWMAGESPVPVNRIGVVRNGLNKTTYAISPNGIYFFDKQYNIVNGTVGGFITYVDHGSDTFVKLCGRADCKHDSTDCNSYLFGNSVLSYHGGYLYAMTGLYSDQECKLIRMEPDGSDHVTVIDLLDLAKEKNGDFIELALFCDGYFMFTVSRWNVEQIDNNTTESSAERVESYIYNLDGSTGDLKVMRSGWYMYNNGDMPYCYGPSQNGGTSGGIWSGDLKTDTMRFIADHPGITGYYDENAGYYFDKGRICRLNYETGEEVVLAETGLGDRYFLFVFPDLLMLASREADNIVDKNLYFYNWAYELVETVEITYPFSSRPEFLVIAETSDRIILSDEADHVPRFFIDKAELGTGNATIHEFKYAG